MPQIVLTDGQNNHTFIQTATTPVATWTDRSSGIPAAFSKVTILNSERGQVSQTEARIKLPKLEMATAPVSGFMPAPRVNGSEGAIVRLTSRQLSTEAEREAFYNQFVALVQQAEFKNAFVGRLTPGLNA